MEKMIVKENYQKKLDDLIKKLNGEVKSVVLHSCCAPCSSHCVEYLSAHFKILVLFYNPNIFPRDEYLRRVEEQKEMIKKMDSPNGIEFIEGDYETRTFYRNAKNRAKEREGMKSCQNCYRFRIEEAALLAKELGYDYFATTLSISPHKNSQILNKIGEEVAEKIGVEHLPSDFKKKNGFKRSVELSEKLGLYRQDYCGCMFSKKERDKRFEQMEQQISQSTTTKILITGCSDDCRHRSVQVVK